MTDELVKRLRDFDPHLHEWEVVDEAADRIEALNAEYEEAMECNEQFFVDNEFLKKQVTALTAERDEMAMSCLSADGEAQRAWDAQKAAEAERDRLREALTQIAKEASVPVHTWKNGINFKKMYEGWRKIATKRIDIARAALKGESHE